MMELMIAATFGYDSGQTFTVASGCLGGQAERSVSRSRRIVFSRILMPLPRQYSAFLRVRAVLRRVTNGGVA